MRAGLDNESDGQAGEASADKKPADPAHSQIYVSNDGDGTILVLNGDGNAAGPAGGNGGSGVSDCNDLS